MIDFDDNPFDICDDTYEEEDLDPMCFMDMNDFDTTWDNLRGE